MNQRQWELMKIIKDKISGMSRGELEKAVKEINRQLITGKIDEVFYRDPETAQMAAEAVGCELLDRHLAVSRAQGGEK